MITPIHLEHGNSPYIWGMTTPHRLNRALNVSSLLHKNKGLFLLFYLKLIDNASMFFRAHDEDSEDSLVTFTLEQPYSAIGHLVLHKKLPTDTRNWKQVGQIWEKVVTSWTQRDIDNGVVVTNCFIKSFINRSISKMNFIFIICNFQSRVVCK